MMESAFDPGRGDWKLQWPERVSQHDLVYLSPPADPMQGIPLGNGDTGALLWCEPSRIIIALNKCDLWDDAAFGRFHNWLPSEEDKSTALRHAGRLIIDLGMPLLDPFYLNDFEGRLDLASAQARIHASTPFGNLNLTAYVSARDGILVINCETSSDEKSAHEVVLERWGSRTFAHWYKLVRREPSIGLTGTASALKAGNIVLTQKLTGGEFAVGCKILPGRGSKLHLERLHSRAARCRIESNTRDKKWTLFLAVTSPVEKGRASKNVAEKLAAAVKKGARRLLFEHRRFWKEFWNKSYIRIAEDYLENLWYLTIYYAGSSSRGKSPATFVNGLWGWNRDAHPWSFYFHWNQQTIYWPLLAAGHPELMTPYLNYRFESLPHAVKDARDWFGTDGAFISDVAERRGYNDEHTRNNHNPVAEIALDFWRYYRFTGDQVFLRDKALPFLIKAAQFFESRLEKRPDGFYHARCGSVCEGGLLVEDAVTELSIARALFGTVLKAAQELEADLGERGQKWREIAENLAPLLTISAPGKVISGREGSFRLKVGVFRGTEVPTRRLLAAGRRIEDGTILPSRVYAAEPPQYRDWSKFIPLTQFPLKSSLPYPYMKSLFHAGTDFYPVFPAETLAWKDRNTGMYRSCVATVKAHSVEQSGWESTPIVLARLGLAEETMTLLEERPDKWQIYCNGFARANSEDVSKAESLFFFGTNLVRDAGLKKTEAEEKTFPLSAWPFRHMEMEPMSVLACAINEMLLQSHDGIIRIAPAYKGRAEFSLHAAGGFIVSAEVRNGSVLWIGIKSLLGNRCQVENPWRKTAQLFENGSPATQTAADLIVFDTNKDGVYLLGAGRGILQQWKVRQKSFKTNTGPKSSRKGLASLGMPRMF